MNSHIWFIRIHVYRAVHEPVSDSVIMIYLPHIPSNCLDPNFVDYASLKLHNSTYIEKR